jgi:DNA-nicking Smr family endonuclease
MIRPGPKDARLWAVVAATVRPLPGRTPPHVPIEPAPAAAKAAKPANAAKADRSKTPAPATPHRVPPPAPRRPGPPEIIEPNRLRLIDRGREPLAATIDLHGLDQDRARAVLTGFLLRAFEENHRTVLVITGKGSLGDGVLRRRTPEWLAEPPLRGVVAGISEAHRARGGAGALYVALKRNPRRGG